jgi:hypothetical protein
VTQLSERTRGKLTLNRETVRRLDDEELATAAGARMNSAGNSCPVTACICLHTGYICQVGIQLSAVCVG